MLNKFNNLKPELKRYLVIGVSVYIFELIVILIAQQLGASAVEAVAWSFILGLTVSFLLQKIITFGDKRMHHKILIPQIIAFCLLVAFNFSFTVLFTKALSSHVSAVICRTVALGITTIWNFYLYKTKIFKSNQEPVY